FASLQAQYSNLGLPYTKKYSKQDYQGGTQNWDFEQDEKGNIFVANNEGLLTYDGTNWAIYPLPNHTIVRSLYYDTTANRLYAGGQDAFGYFTSNEENGNLFYVDCKDKIPLKERQFTDVWNILKGDSTTFFFRSAGDIYVIYEDTAAVYSFEQAAVFLGQIGQQIVVQLQDEGLRIFKDDEFVPTNDFDLLKDKTIVSIRQGKQKGEHWIITLKNGIFHFKDGLLNPYRIQQQNWLLDQRIETADITANGFLALGSSSQGLVLVDLEQHRIHWQLDKKSGLQQNYIRSVFVDQNQDIWLGLDNGIDFIDFNSPFSRFIPDLELESTTYTVRIFDKKLYIGNGNGLYVAPWTNYYDPTADGNIFELIAGSQGQVWCLEEIEGELWVGHEEGAFLVDGDKFISYSKDGGYWKFLNIEDTNGQTQLIAGNYGGLRMLNKEENVFLPVSSLNESARILAKNGQQLWISHPYRGVYQVDFSKATTELGTRFYGQKNGLPSDLENYVFSIFGELLVCAEKGVYRYVEEQDTFQLHPNYIPYFSANEQLRRLVPDQAGNLWYISRTEAGVLRIQQNGLDKHITQAHYPEIRSLLVGGFEYVYPYDEEYVFFGAEKGVIILNPQHQTAPVYTNHRTQLTKFFLSQETGDILKWTGQFKQSLPSPMRFQAQEKNFKFEFTSPVYGNLNQVDYQYYLEGLEDDYGAWTDNTVKEYTNLPAGSYTFFCRSRINKGNSSVADSFHFVILPPWYLTNAAFIVYGFAILLGLWLLIKIPRNQFAKEKAKMVQQQEEQVITLEQEAQASEKTIDELRAEKYRAEIAYQSKELASLTMHIVQKNELISRIGSELKVVREKLKKTDQTKLIKPLERLLTEDEIIENDWEQFVYHFDQVHNGFFQRLRQEYPQLTPKDHKMCAYLRMNLSTKDIAPLLNISVRGVEISRYRLRRKMNLNKEENLVAFMMNF
ncbi:MAG: triple tyrosine motif-containing protein, partial [Bacteroidota bacterium]